MQYVLNFTRHDAYLRADVAGESPPGQEAVCAREVWTRVTAECRKTNLTRILAVWNVQGRLPVLQAYELVVHPEEVKWDFRYKVAVVHLDAQKYQDNLVAETLAVNRGYRLKVFNQESPEALAWLLES